MGPLSPLRHAPRIAARLLHAYAQRSTEPAPESEPEPEPEPVDLDLLVDELGIHAHRDGGVIETFEAPDATGNTVIAWRTEWHESRVPTHLEDAVGLEPPA